MPDGPLTTVPGNSRPALGMVFYPAYLEANVKLLMPVNRCISVKLGAFTLS